MENQVPEQIKTVRSNEMLQLDEEKCKNVQLVFRYHKDVNVNSEVDLAWRDVDRPADKTYAANTVFKTDGRWIYQSLYHVYDLPNPDVDLDAVRNEPKISVICNYNDNYNGDGNNTHLNKLPHSPTGGAGGGR